MPSRTSPSLPAHRDVGRRALIAGAVALAAAPAAAQATWPSQPIRLVVPFPPGGLTDVLGRLVGERLQALGQPVVVDNKPGAATQVGAALVAKAPPDGHTLLVATSTTLGIVPHLYARPLIRVEEFQPVAMLGNVTFFLLARPDFPARDVAGLVAAMRARPGGLSYGSPGAGTAHHLLVELIQARESVRATHVPYQGSAKAIVDLIEGRIDFMFLDASVALPQMASGKVRVLAASGARRHPTAPDVPALTESLPGLDLQAWQSVVAPAGTPPPVVARLNSELNKALAEAATVEQLSKVGVEATPMSVQDFVALLRRDSGRWADLVQRSGAKVE